YYSRNNVAWVLYKWRIDILKYPLFNQTVKVVTEPRAFVRFYAYRTFEMKSIADELLVNATSLWFFVDTSSRKPIKINDDMIRGYNVQNNEIKSLEIEDVRQIERTDFEKIFNVRLSDIDSNDHVNNISYIEWALEVVPAEIYSDHSLRHMKVVYKKETTYGSRIRSAVQIEKNENNITCLHKISGDESDLCFIETIWEKEQKDTDNEG
ncbi:MAG: acyl-[acyl-carrier-protein] thioesterase, partial [Bacillota bacterium]